MIQLPEQLYSAEMQLRVRNSLVYNQTFTIVELQLEIAGLSCDLLSVSNIALRNAHNAGE